MDDKRIPGGIRPGSGGNEESAIAGEAPESEEIRRPVTPVAGIGASAGGLEAFRVLLSALPADTGLAFVFIQHLDPHHRSMLAEILARVTTMPVEEAAGGMQVQPNHVYVVPSNVDLTMAHGGFQLAQRSQTGLHLPVDLFLRSVADECGSGAIGVILSGAGSDGSAGVEAIKAAGGVTFAQDTATAKFPTMPQAAAATGCVDFVLPPADIAAELARIGRHPYLAGFKRTQPEWTPGASDEPVAGILAILRRATGIDFSLYREKMIKRRILRRMALCNIRDLPDYGERLETDADELLALQRDLLISVTSFFRDRESFEYLKATAFPSMLKGRRANETIRVWVAGCATGEEAFSIAISLQEYMGETGVAFPVQIFASDISLPAVERARTGRYRENIAADMTPERLSRYFTKVEGGYQINKDLREMCVFTTHNLIADPPFSKLDLISCRNVLIYLGSAQHDAIIRLFHYALKATGFLMLGAEEAVASDALFFAADARQRIYAKREAASKAHLFPAAAGASHKGVRAWSNTDVQQASELSGVFGARIEIDRILLSKYSPAAVVVDGGLNVLEIRGKADSYLTLPEGRVSFNLMNLIPDADLFHEIAELIAQARKNEEPARRERVPYGHGGRTGRLNLEVAPLDAGKKGSVLVLFEPAAAEREAEPPVSPAEGDIRDRQILRLKQQLADVKERFHLAIEEHQSSMEENENTTEEALSENEELQSLNEELETVKEDKVDPKVKTNFGLV